MSLTDRAIRALQPRTRAYYLSDGDGLYLKVSPTGRLTWFRRSQRRGARAWVKLGNYPAMSLREARDAGDEAKSAGFVPRTVDDAWSEYRKTLQLNYERPGDIEARFRRDILPAIGDRRLTDVKKIDCSTLLIAIVKRGSPVAANRTLPDLRHFFAWCCERGWLAKNPAIGITRKSVGGRERPRAVELSFEQLQRFIAYLLDRKRDPRTRLALALQLCVGQRSSEVLGISSDEVSGVLWTIPVARTKSRRVHKVYLSPQARAILRRAFQDYGARPFNGYNPLVLSRAVARACERLGFRFTPHDLRRTMATRLSDLGVLPHVIEKMLNHQMIGVWAVYNHGEYLPERRAAWRLWGAKLAALRRKSRAKDSCDRQQPALVNRVRARESAVHTTH